jgi:hypothetical protein
VQIERNVLYKFFYRRVMLRSSKAPRSSGGLGCFARRAPLSMTIRRQFVKMISRQMNHADKKEGFCIMRTLKLNGLDYHTLLLTLFIMVLITSIIEILLRIDPIASSLPNSNFGGQHGQLETQFARLDLIVSRSEPINCLLLGDSLVWLGIDPEAFQIAYEDASGQSLHCFNFGVSAMPAAAAAMLADYLVKEYDPILLVYGVHARDLAVPITDEESQIIINNSWFQYRRGITNLPNWFKAHSAIFRNLDYLRAILQIDIATVQNPLGWEYRQLHGFDPKSFALLDVNVPPNPEDPMQQGGFKWYWDYQIREENLVAVKHISELRNQERQVVVVVMPVHSNFMYFFQNGEKDYARFISSLEETLAQSETEFWFTNGAVNIPTDGWYDYSHLNLQGAEIFSTWLGTEVGNSVR